MSPYKQKSVPATAVKARVRAHERWVEYRTNPDAKRAELCQADLRRAALPDATLERAEPAGAILTAVTGLTQPLLETACVDEQAQLPPELTRPAPCGLAKKGARP
jgi:uncharacterized protein YjbI with pentapeptide repeats